jgi:hypothetical protein
MIARVRIAPVERWCPAIIAAIEKHCLGSFRATVGIEIEIDTATMRPSEHCDGRMWRGKAPAGWSAFRLDSGENCGRNLEICEHCLQMD